MNEANVAEERRQLAKRRNNEIEGAPSEGLPKEQQHDGDSIRPYESCHATDVDTQWDLLFLRAFP